MRLGYRHLDTRDIGLSDRLRRRKVVENFPPWAAGGHLLDVGCATGRFLQQMAGIGWRVSGSELDPEAAARARTLWAAGPGRRGEVVRDFLRHAGPA